MSMELGGIGSSTGKVIQAAENKFEIRAVEKDLPPAPGSVLAVPAETARAELNNASAVYAMMSPTLDGIYSIGGTSVKIGRPVKTATIAGGWGF